jgi:uncharacterized membrane protein
MNKSEFLSELKRKISDMPYNDVEKTIQYYGEIIDDRIEAGEKEEDVIASLGSIDDISKNLHVDQPMGTIIRQKIEQAKTKVSHDSTTQILLIIVAILTFPFWFPIITTVLSLFFTFYIVIWSLVIAVGAITIASLVSGIALLICSPAAFVMGASNGLLFVGAGILLLGLSIFMIYATYYSAKGAVKLGGAFLRGVKSLFVSKGVK